MFAPAGDGEKFALRNTPRKPVSLADLNVSARGTADRPSARRREADAEPASRSAVLALDELDLVAVGIGHEGDHRRAAFHRPGLARDGAAVRANAIARRVGVRHGDRDV